MFQSTNQVCLLSPFLCSVVSFPFFLPFFSISFHSLFFSSHPFPEANQGKNEIKMRSEGWVSPYLLGPDLARNLVLKLQRIAPPDGKPLKKRFSKK